MFWVNADITLHFLDKRINFTKKKTYVVSSNTLCDIFISRDYIECVHFHNNNNNNKNQNKKKLRGDK